MIVRQKARLPNFDLRRHTITNKLWSRLTSFSSDFGVESSSDLAVSVM